MYAFNSFSGISSISLDSFFSVRNSFAKQHSVEFSINCSTETMSANLETMVDSREAAKVVNTLWEAAPKGGKTDIIFFTSKKIRMTNLRPHTIFFTIFHQSDCL